MSTVKDQHKTAKALPETGSENNNSNNGNIIRWIIRGIRIIIVIRSS